MNIIYQMSFLIRKGLYPWGCSRLIWIPKPGVKDKLRPITIPNFGDKMVQESIRMVLESIYEPKDKTVVLAFALVMAYMKA